MSNALIFQSLNLGWIKFVLFIFIHNFTLCRMVSVMVTRQIVCLSTQEEGVILTNDGTHAQANPKTSKREREREKRGGIFLVSHKHICQNLSDLNFYRTNEKFVSLLCFVFPINFCFFFLRFLLSAPQIMQSERKETGPSLAFVCVWFSVKLYFHRHFRSHSLRYSYYWTFIIHFYYWSKSEISLQLWAAYRPKSNFL